MRTVSAVLQYASAKAPLRVGWRDATCDLEALALFLHVDAMVLLDVYGADGSLFVNGVPLSIKGVNWFGSESYGGPPGGLTVHTIDFYLDFLQEHKFNAELD